MEIFQKNAKGFPIISDYLNRSCKTIPILLINVNYYERKV